MNTKVNLHFAHFVQTILIVLLLAILIIVSTDSHVQGQIGGDDSLLSQDVTSTQGGTIEGTGIVPGGPGFIMVSPFDFKPAQPSDLWSYGGGGNGLYNPNTTDPSDFVTGLTLPHNATLSKLTLYYKDSHPSKNFYIILYKGDGVSALVPMATLETSGEALAYRYMSTTEITDPVVDNQNYSYFLYVWFNADAGEANMLTNVRIDYAYTSDLPLVMKDE